MKIRVEKEEKKGIQMQLYLTVIYEKDGASLNRIIFQGCIYTHTHTLSIFIKQ
jgi:hypothetical protein